MKGKRRNELKTNELADWVGQKIEAVKPYTSWLIGAAILVVIAIVLVIMRSSRIEDERTQGWESYEEAKTDGFDAIQRNQQIRLEKSLERLKKVAADYAGEPLGVYAKLTIGDLHMATGARQNDSNRPAALEHFKQAADQFAAVERSDSELKDRAALSLAISLEWQWQLNKAEAQYAKVQGPYSDFSQARKRDLERLSTKSFYDTLATWKPKPPGSDLLDKPDFDLDNDGPVAFDYDRYLDATAAGLDVLDSRGGEATPDDATSATGGKETPNTTGEQPEPASEASP